MKTNISQNEWLKLPVELRQKLVLSFAINKSEGTRVVNQIMVSDGCSQSDLINGITIGKMISFIGDEWEKVTNDELFDYLFRKVVDKYKPCEKEVKKEERKDVKEPEAKTSKSYPKKSI